MPQSGKCIQKSLNIVFDGLFFGSLRFDLFSRFWVPRLLYCPSFYSAPLFQQSRTSVPSCIAELCVINNSREVRTTGPAAVVGVVR